MRPIEETQTRHISEYFQIAIKHKWPIIISMVVMTVLVISYNNRLVPIYRATATMVIDAERNRSPITGQYLGYDTYLSESLSFNTHFKLITSRPVMMQVIKDLKLYQVEEKQAKEEFREINPIKQFLSRIRKNIRLLIRGNPPPPPPADPLDSLAQAIAGMITIQNVEETRLLKINVISPSPTRAKDIANGLAEAYIKFNINNRMKSSKDTLSWLTDRLYEMKNKLEEAEQEFLTYKQNLKLVSVEDRQSMIASKISDFHGSYLQARNRRLALETELDQLKQISQSGKEITLLPSLTSNTLILNFHQQLVNAELELSRLSKVYKSKHPKIVEVKSRINQTRIKLDQEIATKLNNLRAERALLLSKEEVLQKTIADFEKEGMEASEKTLQSTILKRNVEMNQNLYDALLTRIKEIDITGDIFVSNIRITENAKLPTFPVNLNKKRNLSYGAILGLMIGIGISLFWEYLDRSLRTEDAIRRYLDLPLLSTIPVVEKDKRKVNGHHPGRSMPKAKA